MGRVIEAKENGPTLVEGPMKVAIAGAPEQSAEQNVIALCRCGGSQNKPFCDGTHSRIGFKAPAVKYDPAGGS
jgi:CDGSH-type Zn-finger protein